MNWNMEVSGWSFDKLLAVAVITATLIMLMLDVWSRMGAGPLH